MARKLRLTGSSFGGELKYQRITLGLSMEKMAERITNSGVKVSRQLLHQWESKRALPTQGDEDFEKIVGVYPFPDCLRRSFEEAQVIKITDDESEFVAGLSFVLKITPSPLKVVILEDSSRPSQNWRYFYRRMKRQQIEVVVKEWSSVVTAVIILTSRSECPECRGGYIYIQTADDLYRWIWIPSTSHLINALVLVAV